jgi:amidophosphoribosyltransferase
MSGIFAVASKDNCNEILFYGTDYHTHLGTQFGGMAVIGEEFYRQIRDISQSQFKSKFFKDLKDMHGNMGIGVISASNEQPIYLNSKFGPFCLVTNGLIENIQELSEGLLKKGITFSEINGGSGMVNETELVANLITQEDDLITGIERMFDSIKGSCSLLLLNKDGVIAARDRYGYTPLIVGKSDNAWAITSETAAFPNTDFQIQKYLEPGEIVKMTESGIEGFKPGGPHKKICSFLWIYTGFPASTYEGINTEIVRERTGKILAGRDKDDPDVEVDLASGVPDSGLGHGIGYAHGSGKPYRRPLVKFTAGYGRSYTPPDQTTRDHIAKMKLIPVKEVIEGNRIVICEDSIVRGTQLKNFTVAKLWESGAKEVHARVACPPLMYPCRFNLSTRTTAELAARKAINSLEGSDPEDVSEYLDHESEKYNSMVSHIAKELGVTTLKYNYLDDMVEAIGVPKEKLCLYCWNGDYFKPESQE